MKDAAPQPIYLADYTPPSHLIDTVDLTFHLSPDATRVISRIAFRPNPDASDTTFTLHGEHLNLIWAKIDGTAVTPVLTETGLTCDVPAAPFVWEAEVEIAPASNTALEGLYISNGMYCTQCEAEGFRRITYYPDRPDVMAVFTVTIHSDLPVLLSNGNPITPGVWHDPWPKPAYLFALVAGDLVARPDSFTTMDGRNVALNIYVRPGDIDKCAFAMDALKASMRWDEQVYGRAYDLDIFNIVAVDDFNMGAMENKGLNIFNSSCVLASPETATDARFAGIEGIIAHEYFHNWTGNRITCRDWFQLCLKEGLTVFRDQQFTADMRMAALKRIDDANGLRSYQFQEDAGPLAHPVRPTSFMTINNFYTDTVYEKGAEVIGMLKTLIGDDAYYEGCKLYFDRHDGQACTIEDWLACFADVTGRDLSQFALWYSQSGTPRVQVQDSFADGTYTLTLTQDLPATPGQPDKQPQVIPVAYGLLAPDGTEVLPTTLLELMATSQTVSHTGLSARPTLSINRNFAAPIRVVHDQSDADLARLLAHDTDPFNRWDAGRTLTMQTLIAMATKDATPPAAYLDAMRDVLRNDALDPAFRARVIALPSEEDIANALFDAGSTPDPDAINTARDALPLHLAQHCNDTLPRIYAAHQVPGPYSPDAASAGHRALANATLRLLSELDGGKAAAAQFESADNMTLQLAAFAALLAIGKGSDAVQAFEKQWANDRLVMNRWFSLQITHAAPQDAAATAAQLAAHPDFDMKNPNRFSAVFGALIDNAAGFHHASGDSYALLANWLIKLDPINPQTTARLVANFEVWPRYDPPRQALMRAALQRIGDTPNLSRDTTEMVTRMLEN
ncbi:aminopeptidase N [Yoonia sp. R2331]|uniref:aminopeptidase N n=1 Tax=Yoonia sp. R2331 TaxID=3237238 RepID=UPI0034E52EA7